MPITNSTNIYSRMGNTFASFSEKERKSNVQEQLAAINYQIDANKRKLQEKLMLVQQISNMGKYVFGNVSQQERINAAAREMGVEPDKQMSIWDWLKSSAFGYDPKKEYTNPNTMQKFTARDLNMVASAPDSMVKSNMLEYLNIKSPVADQVGSPDFPVPQSGIDEVLKQMGMYK